MRSLNVLLIAGQFVRNTIKSGLVYPVMLVSYIILGYAAYTGWSSYTIQNNIREHHQQEARQSWENNPDKHPHRMAHFGTFAFRLRHKLSMFDYGMESFTGNAVFLEAHKQNSVNFSEASLSTSLLRFGEVSMAMLLQIIFPLIIFFLGFHAVTTERENGTLKILLNQGASWKDILLGKSLGLMLIASLLFLPVVIVLVVLLYADHVSSVTADVWLRFAGIVGGYVVFLQITCMLTVAISAASRTSKDALIKLLAIWLVFVILLPKTTQAMGNYFFPSPSVLAFESAVESDLIKVGDSHNPDDPHYKAIKDSLLQTYEVDSVEKLPFNYSGFIMREGERLSAEIYNRHLHNLLSIYQKQNSLARYTAFVNPYAAIKNLSMALSGTDFTSYVSFQNQSEEYRYQLAQHMNELQMELISNKKLGPQDKPYTISREHWGEFPDFQYRFLSTGHAVRSEALSIVSLLLWSAGVLLLINYLSKKLTVV